MVAAPAAHFSPPNGGKDSAMARVKYDGNEVDQNFQIEDGIRGTLAKGNRAVVDANRVTEDFELIDDGGDSAPDADLNQKCAAIAKAVNARFSIEGDKVIFQAPPEVAVSRRVEIIAGHQILGTVHFDSLRTDGSFIASCEPEALLNQPQLAQIGRDLVANKVCGDFDNLVWHVDD
jgi:hypothetical protein